MNIHEFHDKIANFLRHMRTQKNLSDHTCRAYAADLNQFHTFWLSNIPESKLKHALSKFRTNLTKNKASISTLARKMSCFNSYEKYIGKELGIKLNLDLVRPHVPTPIPQPLSSAEVSLLLDLISVEQLTTTHPHRDKAILELLYATGIRCSELIAIRLADLDMATQSIMIHTKRHQPRTVFFGAKTKEQLDRYLATERTKMEQDHEYLFLNYRGQPLTSRSIQRICNMFGTLLPTPKAITPQLLRHSFAAHLLEQGTDPEMVRKLLGFSTNLSIEKYL